ncbi:MAG: hypothetical protein AB1599_10550, partial [Planctomycetota bacterium]
MRVRYLLGIFAVMILFAGCVTGGAVTPFYRYETSKKVLNEPPYLQVLLAEYGNADSAVVKVNSAFNVYPYLANRANKFTGLQPLSKQKTTMSSVTVSHNDGDIVITGESGFMGSDIVLVPSGASALISVGKRSYRGRLRIRAMPDNKIA